MAETIGWVSIYRQIQDHWIWKDPVKFQWWIDILLTVNNADAKVNIGFEIFDCKRGESLMSLQSWGTRWGVSKDTARNFLKLLEKDKMILCVSVGKSTRITVCNYDSYQSSLHVKKTTSKRKPNDEQTPPRTNNNDNNDNNEIKETFETVFERWLKYKKDRRESYVSQDSTQAALNKLVKLSGNKLELAKEILEEAISNNWAGFFELRKTPNQQNSNQQEYKQIVIDHANRA